MTSLDESTVNGGLRKVLPKYVIAAGTMVFFAPPRCRRIRLPNIDAPDFDKKYQRQLANYVGAARTKKARGNARVAASKAAAPSPASASSPPIAIAAESSKSAPEEGQSADENKLRGFIDIPLALCNASPRARPLDDASVRALAASIEQAGLLNPITARRVRVARAGAMKDGFEIVAGHHRVKAFRKLGRETIPAFVVEIDDLDAELAMIDENLCRNDLTPAERASATARRAFLFRQKHGGPKAKGAHAAHEAMGHKHDATAKLADAFTTETAKATGSAERTIRRDVQRGERLGDDAMRIARTSLDKGEELDALVKLTPEQRAPLIARAVAGETVSAKTEVKKAHRETRERDLGARQAALPGKRYGVILADPEWRFETYSRETGMDRAADNHYPTSDLDAIKARDVASIAAPDCALFLWATAPMLPQALDVMAAWGFAYRSHYVWVKNREGTGYWSRNAHELLLIGVRGEVPAPAPGTQAKSYIEADVGAHSAKPEAFCELIERYFPTLPKIELNRRGPARPGWDAWGHEAEARTAE